MPCPKAAVSPWDVSAGWNDPPCLTAQSTHLGHTEVFIPVDIPLFQNWSSSGLTLDQVGVWAPTLDTSDMCPNFSSLWESFAFAEEKDFLLSFSHSLEPHSLFLTWLSRSPPGKSV